MRKIIALAAIALLAGTAGLALADGDRHVRGDESWNSPIARDTMRQKINDLGYDVRRLEVDDGFYKARIVDRASGGGVKATFSLATGELVRAKLASRATDGQT